MTDLPEMFRAVTHKARGAAHDATFAQRTLAQINLAEPFSDSDRRALREAQEAAAGLREATAKLVAAVEARQERHARHQGPQRRRF